MKRIAARVGVSVSTISLWTRDIKLSPEQRERNHRGPGGPQDPERIAKRVASWKRRNRRKRLGYQLEGRTRARERDPLHMAGCMLYWAEGAKARNTAKLANSDPMLVIFFCRFLRESMGVLPEDLRISLNFYTGNGLSSGEIEQYWLDALAVPRSCLRKHSINFKPTSSSGRKKNKLPYGVCTVRVNSTRLVQHIFGAIQEYAAFEEPRWLDGPPIKRRPRKKRLTATAPD